MSAAAAAYGAVGGKRPRKKRGKAKKQQTQHSSSSPSSSASASSPSSSSSSSSSRVSVVVRVRPLLEAEAARGAGRVLRVVGGRVVVLQAAAAEGADPLRQGRSREKRYAFDRVLGHAASQAAVYAETARPLLPGVLRGYNATVFAYGPTGAGKTHTMLGTSSQPGLMLLTLVDLFRLVERSRERAQHAFAVSMSYIEIYNECLYDLLLDDSEELDLREDGQGQAVVVGATVLPITSAAQVGAPWKEGWGGGGRGEQRPHKTLAVSFRPAAPRLLDRSHRCSPPLGPR